MFDEYLARWALTPDGDPIVTPFSRLLPVRRHGAPAMLKIALEAEEKLGSRLMVWWDGQGAARVLAQVGHGPGGDGPDLRQVDLPDQRVGVRRAHDHHPRLVRQHAVVAVQALARQQPVVLEPQDAPPDVLLPA